MGVIVSGVAYFDEDALLDQPEQLIAPTDLIDKVLTGVAIPTIPVQIHQTVVQIGEIVRKPAIEEN